MWRSWVDRINTTGKTEQDDDYSSEYSQEELKRRKQIEIHLQDIWRQCEDLLSTEQERSDLFLFTFLPKFCDLYGQDKEILAFPALTNERAFMGMLSRHLLAGIRKVPEQKTKAESSQALMNSLRSKWHLYYVIKAMYIISRGPVVFLNMMQQQRIPSVITKVFRSFIDLSPTYYDDNNTNDEPVTNTIEKDDENDNNKEMVSLDDAGSVVAGILEQLVRNASILRRLIVDDTFFTIMRLVSTKPVEWDTSTWQNNQKEPAYMIWKHKTIAILKMINPDSEVIQYMHSRRYVEMLVQVWKDALKRPRLSAREYLDVNLDLDLILFLLKLSVEIGDTGLYDELQQVDANKVLISFLVTPPFDEELLNYKLQLVSEIVELTFIGKGVASPTITDGLPYQHDDFVFPKTDRSKGRIVQNLPALQILQSALLYPYQSQSTISSNKPLPPNLQTALFHGIQQVIQKNQVNFFLVERTNVLPLLIEMMENYQSDVQNGIMDLLDYVMVDLNFVPLKELAVLSLHLQSTNSGGKLVGLICRRLTLQLKKSSKLLSVARESGLINMMSLLLSKVNEYLNQRTSLGESNGNGDNNDSSSFVQCILDDFDAVVKCVVEMTKDSTNMTIFRKLYNGNVFDLLHYEQTRMGALELFEALSSHDTGLLSIQSGDESNQSNDVSYAFSRVIEAVQDIPRTDLAFRLEILKTIKRIFTMYPSTRDVFRLSGGYVGLVSMIVALENAFTDGSDFIKLSDQPHQPLDHHKLKQTLSQVLEMILFVLMESMRDNDVNRQYFSKEVGYDTLQNALRLTGALTSDGLAAPLFGMLFSVMVQDETMCGLFTGQHANVLVDAGTLDHSTLLQHIDYTLNDALVDIHNPDVALTILQLQQSVTWDQELANAVLVALYSLIRGNRQNQIKLNRSGLVLLALQRVYPRGPTEKHPLSLCQIKNVETEKTTNLLLQIIKKLMAMGIGDKELRYLFQCFGTDGYLTDLEDPAIDGLVDLILHGMNRSRWPNFIQFDVSGSTSSRRTASLEFSALPNFPPSAPGYTIMLWIHIERWNNDANMTIWTLWDDQQHLFFHVYLDASTRNLHIHSGTNKVDCRFESFEFKPGFWYHIGLVHHKSRLGASLSTVTLFVNGVWMEQARCTYVSPGGPQGNGKVVIGGVSNHIENKNTCKNGHYNTQQQLIWDLGPTYILADTLDGDALNLYFHLGARYKSLYQDSLRQFQTYEASTALFLNLRGITKRREMNKSVLANVMRGGTTTMLPENKILLALIAGNTLAYGAQTGLTLTGLSEECLDRIETDADIRYMLLNSAIPKIEQAIYATNSMGTLHGNPGIAYPFGLDESVWKVGGCALGLNLVQRSESSLMLIKSIELLIEMIRYSWRNSDDMERCHGYEILASILKQKRDLITVDLFELLLHFVGKNSSLPEESVISNPYAYRSVILNFEIWKKTSIPVQKAHLDQFILFMETSNKHTFNLKRLLKVHLVKKMLLAFRMNIYAKELIPNVVKALKAVVLSSWTTESIRAIATFLASTAPNGANKIKAAPTVKRSRLPRANSLSISTGRSTDEAPIMDIIMDSKTYSQTSTMSTKSIHMCNIVMEMLHDILCLPGNQDYVHKFSLTITNKWPLLFFAHETDPYTVVLASRILVRILHVEGPSYMNKFGVASEGFLVMTRLLPHFWNLTQLYETLVILLMGLDIAEYPLYDSFHIKHLQDHIVEKSSSSKPIAGHVLPILMALCREGGRYRRSRIQNEGSTAITIIKIQHELVCLLDELYKRRSDFKEECNRQEIVDDIVEVLFPTLGKSGAGGNDDGLLSVEEELRTKEESAHFDDFCATPSSATTYSPIDGKMMIFNDGHNNNSNVSSPMMDDGSIIKRGGTLTLMTKTSPHLNKKSGAMLTRLRSASWSQHSSITNEVTPLADLALEALLQFLVDISVASVVDPVDKNLTVLNMVLNSYPPSSLDAQMKFESYLLTYISQNLKSTLQFDSKLLGSNVILMNVAKFCQIAADAVLQGRFIDGAEQTYDLLATILETLHSLDGTGIMGRRGLSDTVATLYRAFNRMVLLKISDLEQGDMVADQIGAFLNYCIHHQKIILSPKNTDQEFLRCFCYHLYQFLSSSNQTISNDALNVWKLLLLQKPDAVANVFKIHTGGDDLLQGFSKMLEMDQESFFVWVDSRKIDLNLLFKEHVHKSWESVILQENKYSRETWKNHQARRVNKLKKVQKRQIYEAEIFAEYTTKTAVWSRSIQEVETSRFTKALQDNDGHEKFICSEWSRINSDLTRERAIWGPQLDSTSKATHSKWALDFTEGRHRMRKKIRCISDGPATLYLPKHDSSSSPPSTISEKTTPRSPLTSSAEKRLSKSGNEAMTNKKTISEVDEELTSDPIEQKHSNDDTPSATADDNDETKVVETENEDDLSYEEDKNQKVLRLLDAGDMVLDVYNVSRIEGLDAREGLLLICKHHIYLVDNFFQRVDGEVVEIWDVPKHERDEYLLLLAQAAGMETEHPIGSSGDLHTCRKWANADLREVFKRRFLFRDVALELFFADGQNALITVERSERDDLFTKLVNRVTTTNDNDMKGSIFGAVDKESSTLGNAFKFTSIFGSSTLHDLTQKWERREITNFQYLMYINAIAGRSYNDLTQYPVFPWILADYTSEKLDLDKPETFRDLSKPMGAQTAERRDEFQDRYRQWGETNDPAPAFHYGTHYSSAMIVCSFLIRLEPFTQHYLKLQGGTFDHADRLFDSVGKAWESASEKNMGDVRELIPEFFCLPEFLENVNKFNFGTKQGTGETIDSVTLPPWASNDPKIFIQRHREALESDYVSQNLHHWIDLIFGYKQQGKAAIDALNVFHHVSYEGAVDLDAITDTVEKTATIGIINNFGQTPRQLFKKPHPARSPPTHDPLALGFYPLRSHLQKLIQSIYPLRDIHDEIGDIGVYNDKLGVTTCQQLYIPPDALHYIEWGYSDNSLRLYSSDSGKLINVFENFHDGFISSAHFADSRTLVTGGTDSVVCVWKIEQGKQINFELQETLRGHSKVVTTITSSRSYSIIVTGSQDKSVIIWDLNRLKYVRSLSGHESGVHLVRVNDATGDIITCSGNMIRIWTINGELYLTKSVCANSERVLSCAIYDAKPNEWSSQDLIITGHRNGIVKFWAKDIVQDEKTGEHKWTLNQLYQLTHANRIDSTFDSSDIVSLSFSQKRTLLTGNRNGQVYAFVLPDTSDTLHYLKEDRCKECAQCGKSFSVLERKSFCRSCGGLFCLPCISNIPTTVPDKSARFCKYCQSRLLE